MNTFIDFDISGYYDTDNKSIPYDELKTNDKIKNDYCEDNYINLIRIKYDQINIIQEILWDNLKIFIKDKKSNTVKVR